jgi:hypothetical protein
MTKITKKKLPKSQQDQEKESKKARGKGTKENKVVMDTMMRHGNGITK